MPSIRCETRRPFTKVSDRRFVRHSKQLDNKDITNLHTNQFITIECPVLNFKNL